jgi:hypothetical protein
MIAKRASDGSAAVMPYTPRSGVGFWQPTPPNFPEGAFQQWGKVTPFGLTRPDQFRPKPPPKLTSGKYARDYNEVKDVGSFVSTLRPQDRANVARFASLTSPIPIWNAIATQLTAEQNASLTENARTFALMNMAITDAAIAVFEAKYFYNLWRPITAIRAGDTDGNPKTDADPSFSTFITTPPYPSYPSGFGGLSSAGRYILEDIYGEGRHDLSLSLPALPGVTLHYTRLHQLTDDIADARVYSGIHFRFDQVEAELLGLRVAVYIRNHHLRCAGGSTCEDNAEDDEGN